MLWQNNSDVMVPLQPQHGQDATRLLVNFNSGLLESVQRKTTIIKKKHIRNYAAEGINEEE